MILRRPSLPLAAFALCLSALIVGCAQPTSGRDPVTLRLRLASDPISLDPAMAVDESAAAVISQLFDGLVALDAVTGEPLPSIARRWEVDENGTVYTFTLKRSARFHHGRRVEADDVVYTFERLLSPSTRSPHGWILEPVLGSGAFSRGNAPRLAGVRALDPETVRVELTRPHGPFLSLLAMAPTSILPREIYSSREDEAGGDPVGAGPFEFRRRDPGRQLVLGASGFHHDGTPGLSRLTYRIIPSAEAAADEYVGGSLDLLDDLPLGRRLDLMERFPAEVRRHARPAVAFLSFDHSRPPFKGNPYLRKAFNYAIDRAALTQVGGRSRDLPARVILPPGVAGHDAGAPGYPHDAGRARVLLSRAGFPGGRGLPGITLGYLKGRSHRLICRRIREDLAGIGVKVSLRELDPEELMDAMGGSISDAGLVMFRMAWLADYPDPDAFLRPTLHSSSPPESGNYGRYVNRRFDRTLDTARAEPDIRRRLRLYRKAERIALEDAAWVLLYHYGDEALVKPHVTNLIFPTFGELQGPLHHVRLSPGTRVARF